MVDDLCSKRSNLLERDFDRLAPGDLGQGRLLAFSPLDSLSEGHLAIITNGFFDVDESPPWDTWLWFQTGESTLTVEENLLVSWVPPDLIQSVQAAIDVQSAGWVNWLGEYK
jgi:hypothetical protein